MIGKNMFMEAVSAIDGGFIEEAVIAENKFHNKKRGKSIVIKFAAAAACVALILAVGYVVKSGLKFKIFKNSIPTPPISYEVGKEDTIFDIGSDNNTTGHNKPLTSHRVWAKSRSYYEKREKAIVTVGMAEGRLGDYLNDDTITGYPLFKAVVIDEIYGNAIKNSGVIINGCEDEYSIKFDETNMSEIDIDLFNDEPEEYHQEQLEIDFSDLEPGDCGKIKIHFGWLYESGGEENYDNGNGYGYHSASLSYFVGEEGVGLSFSSVDNAKENLGKIEDISQIIKKEDLLFCSSKELYLQTTPFSCKSFVHGSVIEQTYELRYASFPDKFVVNITADEGIALLSEESFTIADESETTITVKFKLDDDFKVGKVNLEVDAYDEADEKIGGTSKELYCLYENSNDHISLHYEGLAPFSQAIADEIDAINRAGESMRVIANTTNLNPSVDLNAVSSYNYNIYGYIKWIDNQVFKRPAQNITVQIFDSDNPSTVLSTTTTNSDGYYSFNLISSKAEQDIFIRIKMVGLNVTVKNVSGQVYYYDTITYKVKANEATEISHLFDKSSNLGKSVSVHQAMELANRFVYSLEGSYMSNVDVIFPDDSSTSAYSPSQSNIHILTADAYDWDVLEHEYGHYVQDYFDITSSPGDEHYANTNLIDARGNKSDGIRLAWGEGWATYFSIYLQKEMNAASLGIQYVGDSYYTDIEKSSTINYDIENLPVEKRLGEANEAVVAATLYDLADGISTADNDNIDCRTLDIWNITLEYNCCTLSDFMAGFYNAYATSTDLKAGQTLSDFKVAAKLNYPTGLTSSTPTFSWINQGGSERCPNNYFRLAFYNSSNNVILKTAYTRSSSTTLTAGQWNQIKSAAGNNFYCCVETMQTHTPQTGPYYSNVLNISLSISETYKITNLGANKCLNIYGSNLTSLSNGINVTLWSDSGSNEQKWVIVNEGSYSYIKSLIDTAYGLNVYRSGSPYNCNIRQISGNETDSRVVFIETSGGYKIKLYNYDLYLTVGGSANGTNVYWAAASSSSYQIWKLSAV